MTTRTSFICTIALCGALLAGCGEQESAAVAEPPDPAPPSQVNRAALDRAISAERLAGDREQDAWRNPSVVLSFLEVRPGMRVIDYLAAGGYYTELLSRAVGEDGAVVAYNNEPYLKFSGEAPAKRYANERLPNVTQVTAPPETVNFGAEPFDAALFVQSYHDLHWRSKDGSWPETDPVKALAALSAALKPGATVVVLDHVGADGVDPATSVDALHRIDPAIVRRDFEAAGFVFDGESTVFANPDDDHSKPVFDESIRRKTDQFLYRFVKK